jgi:tetratricopeptide (TPR) repeat protein
MIVENVSKKYQKTIAYAQALQAIQPLNDAQNTSLAEAYYFTNDFAHVKDLGQKVIAASRAAGTLPPKGVLQMLMNSDLNTGDKAGAEAISEELAVNYNVPSDWARLIDIALQLKGTSSDALNLLRLGVAAGASLDAADYSLMGDIAMRSGLYGDALVAAHHGGKVPGATAKAAADQKDLPGLIAAARNQDAKHNIVLAEDLYGFGRYAEAEELARRALSKGSPAGEANMLIGMSLAGQGKYAEAVTAFGQVSGGPSTMKGAHLWSRFAQRKGAPVPAAATTPAAATH